MAILVKSDSARNFPKSIMDCSRRALLAQMGVCGASRGVDLSVFLGYLSLLMSLPPCTVSARSSACWEHLHERDERVRCVDDCLEVASGWHTVISAE